MPTMHCTAIKSSQPNQLELDEEHVSEGEKQRPTKNKILYVQHRKQKMYTMRFLIHFLDVDFHCVRVFSFRFIIFFYSMLLFCLCFSFFIELVWSGVTPFRWNTFKTHSTNGMNRQGCIARSNIFPKINNILLIH